MPARKLNETEEFIIDLLNKTDDSNKEYINNLISVIKHSNGILNRQRLKQGNFKFLFLGDVYKRREEFAANVMAYHEKTPDKYPKEDCFDFIKYWGTINVKKPIMRCEDDKITKGYFSIGNRLGTWMSKRNNNYISNYK